MSQQRAFNFFSVPATSSTLSSSSNSSNQKQSNVKPSSSNQKRPFKSSSTSSESESSNQPQGGKKSKFFAQKPSSQTTLGDVATTTTPKLSSSTATAASPSVKRTRVVKLQRKDGKVVQDCEVYIGRALFKGGWSLAQSKWGNPYPVSTCGGSAEVACQKYRDYVLRRDDLLKDLDELDGKVLGCWCKVDASCHCHGDTLVELLEMKKNGELDAYVKNYLEKYPEPLYPITNSRAKKN